MSAAADSTQPARLVNAGAAILSFAVLGDSALEHYRGSFQNRIMYAPLGVAALTLATSLHGTRDVTPQRERHRDKIYGLAALTGLVGSAFHAYNVGKRPGGFSWLNLFYGAPIGAPMALLLAGLLGISAERLRGTGPDKTALFGLPAGRALGAVAAAGLAGTAGEAALLHFRGAFQDPFMVLPVTVPPVASALLAAAVASPRASRRPFTRLWLRMTAALGMAGVAFHAFGVQRNMGGWRNWTQNLLNGPPLPAPPGFTGLALCGLAALRLLERAAR